MAGAKVSALTPRERVLVALDTGRLDEALALVAKLRPLVGGFKAGLELCSAEGTPRVVQAVAAAGGSLFLDLKLHDIPNTVAGAVRAVCALGPAVRMLTLHCQGGAAMLRAAVEAARASAIRPLLLGVTVLTSMDQATLHDDLGIDSTVEAQVARLAQLAQACGLDGVVASPREVAVIRAVCGERMLIVTPGIRPTWAAVGDQQRTMTPREAFRAGADYLVIGRPIIAPPPEVGDPAVAAARIVEELDADQ